MADDLDFIGKRLSVPSETLANNNPEAIAAMERAIRKAEARALTTPCPSPCECGHWIHQCWCPTGRANLDRFTGFGHG